jgi:hypothetical protein
VLIANFDSPEENSRSRDFGAPAIANVRADFLQRKGKI